MLIANGPSSSRPSATAPAKPAMARIVIRIALLELVAALRGLQPGEVGEQRALDGLEELQRRARDQQRVEDVAGHRGVRGGEVGGDHARVEQRLLGEHDAQHGDGEAPAAGEPERLLVLASCACSRCGRRENASGTTTSETNGAAAMPIATTVCPLGDPDQHRDREQQPRRRLDEHQPAVEREPLVPGEPAAREVARRVRQHGDDQHPVQRGAAVEQVVLDRVPEDQRDDQERERERPPG